MRPRLDERATGRRSAEAGSPCRCRRRRRAWWPRPPYPAVCSARLAIVRHARPCCEPLPLVCREPCRRWYQADRQMPRRPSGRRRMAASASTRCVGGALDDGEHLVEAVLAAVARDRGRRASGRRPYGSNARNISTRSRSSSSGASRRDVAEVAARPSPGPGRAQRTTSPVELRGAVPAAGRSRAAARLAAARRSIGSPMCQVPVPELLTTTSLGQPCLVELAASTTARHR